jgi:hypothetical protein
MCRISDNGFEGESLPLILHRRLCLVLETKMMQEDTVEYEALSYAWGSVDNLSFARIAGGGVCAITHNLAVALRHLRFQDKARLMWIDALCINQDDTAEKNNQVAVMGKIFSFASHVLMWLGPEADRSEEAIRLLENLSKEVQIDTRTLEMRPSSQCTSADWADTTCMLPFKAGELTPVHALYERPYFKRAWIRQEIVLAKRATVYCGQRQLNWQDFRRGALCLSQKLWDEDLAMEKGKWRLAQQSIHAISNLCLILQYCILIATLRYSSGVADCQDSRDRIYSILSLIGGGDYLLAITPDYDIPVGHLYLEIARRIACKRQNLTFLDSCHPASNILELPTWVPDWSTHHPITSSQAEISWSACGFISAQARVEGNTLYATGVSVARIETIQRYTVETDDSFYESALRNIREMKPTNVDFGSQNGQQILRNWSLAMTGGLLDSTFSVQKLMEILEILWSSGDDWVELQMRYPGISPLYLFVGTCYHVQVSRCFFTAGNGYAGLGLPDMQVGDVVCVFLGCDHPIVVRPVHEAGTPPLWRVVGSAIVPGIMNGEAIYGGRLPSKYQLIDPATQGLKYRGTRDNIREGLECAIYDIVNNIVIDNPTSVLDEAGIKVDHYEKWPYQLDVAPETLRAAGVALEEFALI